MDPAAAMGIDRRQLGKPPSPLELAAIEAAANGESIVVVR